MSELIQNSENRKNELKDIIKSLNAAGDPAVTRKAMKKRFASILKTLSPEEIAEAEQALIGEGMPVEEVQRLCELHVDAFEDTLKKNAGKDKNAMRISKTPGHPIATYRAENAALRGEVRHFMGELGRTRYSSDSESLRSAFESVCLVEIHYARKENQLFPYLENAGFTGPSKVMWGKHNEIRDMMRSFRTALDAGDLPSCKQQGKIMARSLKRMIFMEEKILFPTSLRKLPEAIWISIRRGEAAIGYAWIKPGNLWDPNVVHAHTVDNSSVPEAGSTISLSTGSLTREQLDLMLTHLPLDISYVDEHDLVQYYTDNADRVFPRSPGIIGRAVQNCHPPASVHVVQGIIDDFKSRKRSEAEFWIQMKGKFIHIRYYPLFIGDTFKGIIEVTQDVTSIRALEGERRLLDDERA